MFNTPPHKMVRTRSMMRKEQHGRDQDEPTNVPQKSNPTDDPVPSTSSNVQPDALKKCHEKIALMPGGSIKSEPPRPLRPPLERHLEKPKSVKSCNLSTSSVRARKMQLMLEAERQKAQIKMDLIDKQLAADMADLESEVGEQYSPSEVQTKENVEKWMESSYLEIGAKRESCLPQASPIPVDIPGEMPKHSDLEALASEKPAPTVITSPPGDPHDMPTTHQNSENALNVLANALKEITIAAVSNKSDSNLLSRLSTPRDLPEFSGDPLEWLQFKHAYYESTTLCKFKPQENLWRLRKCLRGAAKEATAALFISASSPDIIMSMLQLRFGNPDYILSKIVSDIRKLQPMNSEYQRDIVVFSVKIQNFVEAVRATGREEYLQGLEISSIILSKLPTVLLSKWSDHSYPLMTEGYKGSRLVLLADFLKNEALKVSHTANTFYNTNSRNDSAQHKYKNQEGNTHRSHTMLLRADNKKCTFCKTVDHKLVDCKQFKRALRKVRWQHVKRTQLCYKCIAAHHDRGACPAPVCDVDDCGQPHHRLLHYPGRATTSPANQEPGQQPRNEPQLSLQVETDNTETVTHINASDNKVFLKIVPISIRGPNGIIKTSALCDDGSTVSLISAELASRAGVRGRAASLRVCGAWNNNELVCETIVMNVDLISRDNKVHSAILRSVNNLDLPLNSGLSLAHYNKCKHLLSIRNDLCDINLKPEILIGQDNYHLLLPLEVRVGKPYEPSATLTPLGWCLHGNARVPRKLTSVDGARDTLATSNSVLCVKTATDDYNMEYSSSEDCTLRDLHDMVKTSFSFDSLGISGTPRQNIDDVRAISQLEKSAKLVDGRWVIGLPWRDQNCRMPDSYPKALQRLKGIERRMSTNKEFEKRYKERIQHLLDNDFARKLTNTSSTDRTWYLPHFGVDNPNKKKLRLVFDAAAKSNGLSLNDYLLKGPDLLTSLFGIMLRFRENPIAVTGDIKDMFLRIKIKPEDQNAFRFISREDLNGPVHTYVMTSLIFEANCSPFIAQFVKNKNAASYMSSLPCAVNAINNQHYMDDYIDSLPDASTAIKLVRDVTFIHKMGNFEICNWTSNNKEVLDSLPDNALGNAAVKLKNGQQYDGERTLGLIWDPSDDTLRFDVSFKLIPENIINGTQRPTKRDILRVVMSIFDVFGFLSPFTIIGKIILQDTWKTKISWDDYITDNIFAKWLKWISLMKCLRRIRMPRYYQVIDCAHASASETEDAPPAPAASTALSAPRPPASQPATMVSAPTITTTRYTYLQLHIFCDASIKAVCAVAYWRWIKNECVYVAFITSRCRVAPVKPVSIPRLELQAAVLAARLAATVTKEHRIKAEKICFWCDSSTVLTWIRNDARNHKQYVAHRLGEIDELSQSNDWRYVPTKLNVADIGTRESYDLSTLEEEWLHGPNFLKSEEHLWPSDLPHNAPEKQLDVECITCMINDNTDIYLYSLIPDVSRFSSWLRLLRTTSNVLKFIDKCRRLTCDKENYTFRAEVLLLKQSQAQTFLKEINKIKNKQNVSRNSKLLTLSPYLDDNGVLRVGGRIGAAAAVSPEMKNPVILDGQNYIARLILRYYHHYYAHGNQETVVNEVRQKYWITRLRPVLKTIASQCMTCRIRKSKPEIPRMGDLPSERMAHHQRPFTYCGVDLFGPMEVTVGRRRDKRYGVLFTCMTVRAIHLEVVHSLTSDSFIMALRRMAARRGWPHHLFSDNGTNFRGANTELHRAMEAIDQGALDAHGTKWSFIPPVSPHWGGAWERLIRSVKVSLKVILNERAPKDETLNTLLAEVENIVNSRPLTHVSVDPRNPEALTPNHFLIGSSSNLPQIGIFNGTDEYLRKQWRISQRLADLFWQRWVKEVLPDMLPRKKWQEEQRNLQVGDLVLVIDPNGPRNLWPKGVVQEVVPGKDGRVRMVRIKTRSGTLTRSSTRVARIPLDGS